VGLHLAQGFAYPGGLVGTTWVGPFTEQGLRSETLGFIAKRFVAATARQIESGRRKDGLARGSSKLLGLDDAYVRLNRKVVSGFRIDLDAVFDSFDALHAAVARCRLPSLPHLAVGQRDRDGRIHNPHLWYILPDTGAVWMTDAASKSVIALLHRVIAGVTAALRPIGADIGGLANPFHGKNPLSPLYSTEAWNEHRFLTLADWASAVDLRAQERQDMKDPARRGAILSGSNSQGRTLFGWAVQALRDADERGDPDYVAGLDDRPALGRHLCDLLRRDAVLHLDWTDEPSLQRQCRRIAEGWDVTRLAGRKNRGRLKGVIDPQADLATRQRQGQAHTAQVRVEKTVLTLAQAIANARAANAPLTQSGLARTTGLARSTIARHWQRAEGLSHSVLRKKGFGSPRSLGSSDPSERRGRAPKGSATPVQPSITVSLLSTRHAVSPLPHGTDHAKTPSRPIRSDTCAPRPSPHRRRPRTSAAPPSRATRTWRPNRDPPA
jgi:hypothetical protein